MRGIRTRRSPPSWRSVRSPAGQEGAARPDRRLAAVPASRRPARAWAPSCRRIGRSRRDPVDRGADQRRRPGRFVLSPAWCARNATTAWCSHDAMGRGRERRAQALSRRGGRGGAGIGVGRGATRPLRQHPGTQRLRQSVPALRGRIGEHFRRRPAGRGVPVQGRRTAWAWCSSATRCWNGAMCAATSCCPSNSRTSGGGLRGQGERAAGPDGPGSSPAATRANCPAACVSGSRSAGPWWTIPGCC